VGRTLIGGKRANASYFEESIIKSLEWIQWNTEGIIPKSVNLTRRGETTAALNAGLDGLTIDAINGW
jgi:hypothetical protein